MLIVLFGPPGAGKGTQSELLSAHLAIPHLSTGMILRQTKASESELGKMLGPKLDAGELISDDLMIDIVSERISHSDCANGFLLDGFPRTIPQAKAFDQMLTDRELNLDAAIGLQVDQEELVTRLNQRYVELEVTRPEDAPEAIPKRIALYESQTAPLFAFYQQSTRLVGVNGLGDPQEVLKRILDGVGVVND